MPSSGKTTILNSIDFCDVVHGSNSLREMCPEFDSLDYSGKDSVRKRLAESLLNKDTFIMDGHYLFGDEVAFTSEDGNLYDVIVYLYTDPDELKSRMALSDKNNKFLIYDIAEWQKTEIDSLRQYCWDNDKDFYVIDNPPINTYRDITEVLEFIKHINDGYSCVSYARECAASILGKINGDTVFLYDGDKTLTKEDSSSAVFGYKTNIYDGNFYTGYQSWKQSKEFALYHFDDLTSMPVHMNSKVSISDCANSFILTSGHERIWSYISKQLGVEYYCGIKMSADTKFFITKFIQKQGKRVIAYGDGMNDYYMLRQADIGYLIAREDGSVSRSLKGKTLEGLIIV